MTTARHTQLPQFSGQSLLTDGGLETVLIFEMGFDLPEFASFPLLDTPDGRTALDTYYADFIDVAINQRVGIVLETPTWRASADWGQILGYDAANLDRINQAAIAFLRNIAERRETPETPIIVSGNIGPRGDGYTPGDQMTVDEAEAFHTPQIASLADAGADMVTIMTVTYAEEGIGAAKAAAGIGIPIVVSFTVETDGSLPTGQPLGEAIEQAEAATGGSPASYGINCAHPDHFASTLSDGGRWVNRIGLVRANASRMSHQELDNAEELDAGDRDELGQLHRNLRTLLPSLTVLGGCCGTDAGHVAAIAAACFDSTDVL
ncbi:MAG: S-methylmethionine-dependent homocysteine/selenocysteine methylase [Candidatus Aldehydirespiratoraceae bacterium]|jgi:S-methylmethionine-dependent homocysteine/selenocysteine methylase